MAREHRWPIVLLPGGILPAQPAYQALLAEFGDAVDARAKDLEMYAGETVPPPGYSLETEVGGIRQVAENAGFETFHLVGYSAGGASSLAFASRHPERLRSLALMEPAWAGREGPTPSEATVFERFRAIPELPPDGIMPAFIRTQLAPDVEPPVPPPGTAAAVDAIAVDGNRRVHARIRRFRTRLRGAPEVRPAGLLRPRRPRQSRPLCADGGASRQRRRVCAACIYQ